MKCVALIVLVATCVAFSSADPFFSSIASSAINSAKNTINTAGNVAKGTVSAATNVAKGTVSAATNVAKGTASVATDVAKGTVSAATNVAKGTASVATNVAKGTVSAATTVAKGTVATAQNAANQVVNVAKDVTSASINFVKDISSGALNTGVKFVLSQMRNFVRTMNLGTINLPPLDSKFGPVTLNATGGYFQDVSTIAQSGDLSVDMKNASIIIDFPVKLDVIQVGYKNFTVGMWKLKANGGIKVNVGNNTFSIRLRLKPGLNCVLNFERIEVLVFDNVSVKFENMCSGCEWVLNKASDLIVKFLKNNIRSTVQNSIDDTLRKAFSASGPMCSQFMG